jgi:hypothetical protein
VCVGELEISSSSLFLEGEVITTEDLKDIEDPVMVEIEVTPEGVVQEKFKRLK